MIDVAKVEVGMIHDWVPEPGSFVSWQPIACDPCESPAGADRSAVPASYTQAQHLRDIAHTRPGVSECHGCSSQRGPYPANAISVP